MIIEQGSSVRLHFRLSLPDGLVVDETFGDEPLDMIIGQGDMVEGLEQRLLGLAPGDRRRFEIAAYEAYGDANPDSVQEIARADFPSEETPVADTVMSFQMPSGEEVLGTILSVDDERVLIDFSHPLAGHDIIFEVEIVAVDGEESP